MGFCVQSPYYTHCHLYLYHSATASRTRPFRLHTWYPSQPMPFLLVSLGQCSLRAHRFSRVCKCAGCSLFPALATAYTFRGSVTGRVLSFFTLPGGVASFEYLFLFCVSAFLLPAL